MHLRDSLVIDDAAITAAVRATGLSAEETNAWIATQLAEAATDYFTAFALAQAGTPSERAAWANKLRTAAATCLRMLAPDASDGERPSEANPRAHSLLFAFGSPTGIEPVSGDAAVWSYDPAHDALNAIPGKLWELVRMATLAEEEWTGAKAKSMKRMQTDRAIRSWALSLWIIYRQAFRADVPRQPKPRSPFVRFADMAREAVLRTIRSARNSATADVIVTESGTDAEAHRALAHLTAARLASFVKRHRRQLEDLAERHRPERQRPERHRQVSAGVKRGNRGADSKGPRSARKEI